MVERSAADINQQLRRVGTESVKEICRRGWRFSGPDTFETSSLFHRGFEKVFLAAARFAFPARGILGRWEISYFQ